MAVFKYYNVQVLPLNKKQEEIGVSGYLEIFRQAKKAVDKALNEEESLKNIAFSLRNDFYFSPLEINVREDMVYGKFIKFDQVNEVMKTISRKRTYTAGLGESSKVYEYKFVFDPVLHILAIEFGASLPAASVLSKTVEDILKEYKKKKYSDYRVEVIELTASASLDKVLRDAKGFYAIKSIITFSNSNDFLDGLEEVLEGVENEMKEKGIATVEHKEAAAKDSIMDDVSTNALVYAGLSCKFGNTEISYKDKSNKKQTFKMAEFPVKERVSESKNKHKTVLDYYYAVKNTIKIANDKARAGVGLLSKIRQG